MARIPSDPTPDPIIDSQTTPPPEPAPNFDGVAFGDTTGTVVALSDEQLRQAAGTLGLNFDAMNAEEHEFVAMFARGALDSQPPVVDGDINDDPIILPDGTAVAPTTPAATPDPSAATLETGADGAGVGSAPDEPEGGGDDAVAPTTSPEQVVAAGAPGAPAFDIPSPLPPVVAPPPEPAPAQEPLVMLPNGQMVPLSYAQALLAQQQQQPPIAPQPFPPQPQPAPPFQPQPSQQFPTPFGTEYVDERAGAEITALRQQVEQMNAQMQAENIRARAQHEQAIDQAIRETTSGYGNARGLTPQEAEALLNTATQLGALGMYSQMYPGDPRRAVGAALEMTYWITPEMRQREIDRTLESERQGILETERKKALAGSVTSSPGSVPRTPAPARTRAEQDQGIVAMIEQDLARQNGGAGAR